MKGQINKDGILEVWRKDKYKELNCIYYTNPNNLKLCGDDCSHFNEPIYYDMADHELCEIRLELCNKFFRFKEFIDER